MLVYDGVTLIFSLKYMKYHDFTSKVNIQSTVNLQKYYQQTVLQSFIIKNGSLQSVKCVTAVGYYYVCVTICFGEAHFNLNRTLIMHCIILIDNVFCILCKI